MRNLKYIKLFEAFESTKLTKTLGYVSSEGANNLISTLKRICANFDFPFSKLDDSYFQYLPFNKALKLQYVGKERPCQATSTKQFGSSGVEGETCQSGKMKRMWGSRTRVVDCPNCGGTGIQPESQELKLIKFWFTKEGNPVVMSGVDNIHKPKMMSTNPLTNSNISYKNIGEVITSDENESRHEILDKLSVLKHGDIVRTQLQEGGRDIILARVWVDTSTSRVRYFLIQDSYDGNSPSGNFREWGRYGWNITTGEFVSIQRIELIEDLDAVSTIDPFSFNLQISGRYPTVNSYQNRRDLENKIKMADFALVFDLEKLKNSQTTKVSDIISSRQELKSGSTMFQNEEEIRKANIQRYMQQLAQRSDIISDVSNLPKVLMRLIGGDCVFFMSFNNSRFTNILTSLAERYMQALSNPEEELYQEELSNYIKTQFSKVSEQKSRVSSHIQSLKKNCLQKGLTEELEIIDGLDKLSKFMYEKLSKMPMECIEDIEILKSKIDSFREAFRTNRYSLDYFDYLIGSMKDYSTPDRPIHYLVYHYHIQDNKMKLLESLKNAMKFIERF